MINKNFCTTVYSIPFTGFAVTSTGGASAFDLWSVKASSLSRVSIEEIEIGQLSSAVANNQQIAIQVMRGSTALGGGAAVTAQNLKGWSAAPVALLTANAPSSSLASTASASLIHAADTNYSGGWFWKRTKTKEMIVDAGQALNIRVSAPPITVQISGTLTLREEGKPQYRKRCSAAYPWAVASRLSSQAARFFRWPSRFPDEHACG